MSITLTDAIETLNAMANTRKMEDADWVRALNFSLKEHRSKFILPWAQRRTQLLVYPNVVKYASPSDMDFPHLPQKLANSENTDDGWFQGRTQKSFARRRDATERALAIDWERDTKYLLVRYPDAASEALLHNLDDHDANGTWTAGGDASAVATDTGTAFEGAGSVRFTITNSAASATLTNSDMAAVDLTDFKNRCRVFFSLDVPVAGLTAVAIRWGSSASAYWEVTGIATQFHGAGIAGAAWNLFSANWTSAITESGSPDAAAVNYVRVTFTNGATSANYHLDHIVFRRYKELELPYSSKNLVLDANGTLYKEELAVNTTDTITGDDAWDNLILHSAVKWAAKYVLKDRDLFLVASTDEKETIRNLKTVYPSAVMRPSISYYPRSLL